MLESERLLLMIPTPEMALSLAELCSRNRHHFAGSSPRVGDELTASAWSDLIRTYREDAAAGRALRLVLILKDDPTRSPIGTVSLTNIVRGVFQATHLGYRIDQGHEGQGLMTEAVRRAIDFAFEDLGLHRIMANYVPTNERSARLLRRLGFTVEGYARDYLYLDGAWRDHVLTALVSARSDAVQRDR
jgi:ribosomal-protein-alanine N-acetyltransferase